MGTLYFFLSFFVNQNCSKKKVYFLKKVGGALHELQPHTTVWVKLVNTIFVC